MCQTTTTKRHKNAIELEKWERLFAVRREPRYSFLGHSVPTQLKFTVLKMVSNFFDAGITLLPVE